MCWALPVRGAEANSTFYWARNDGQGNFTILDNIDAGDGDFLQGVAVERFDGEQLSVALSWHQEGKGIQRLIVPPASHPTMALGGDLSGLTG
jgi:hypothetical protein